MNRLELIRDEIVSCARCPRLVESREMAVVNRRAAFSDDTYWSRAVPSFSDPEAELVVVGLAPAARGANRTGRMFTGDAPEIGCLVPYAEPVTRINPPAHTKLMGCD